MHADRSQPGTYAPRGVVTKKTVQVRLLEEELDEFEGLVDKENVSDSAMGRRLMLRGMRAVREGEAV